MVNWRLFLEERVSRFRNDNVRHDCHRSGKFKGKWITSRHGKSLGISLWVRENWHLWTESGKSKILSKYGVVHLAIAIFITVDKAWNVCSNGVGTMVNKIWKNMAGKMLKGMIRKKISGLHGWNLIRAERVDGLGFCNGDVSRWICLRRKLWTAEWYWDFTEWSTESLKELTWNEMERVRDQIEWLAAYQRKMLNS